MNVARRDSRGWRLAVVLAVLGSMLVLPAIAQAGVTGDCTGSVTIDGNTYGPENDTADNPIVVPMDKEGVVADWEGGVGFANTNHAGSVGIVIGPWTIELGDWSGVNSDDDRDANGDYSVDELKSEIPLPDNLIPLGIYEVTAEHSADGGSCTGTVMVKLEGSNALSVGSAVGAGVTFLTLLGSGIRRKF